MLILTLLGACGWWERHQACTAATEAEERSWAALEAALTTAADASQRQAEASLAAAQAVDLALSVAGEGGKPGLDVNRAEMAQDAFTRASRAAGTLQGLAQATWTDWSLRTQDQVAAADVDVERARVATERLSLWSRAAADSSLTVALRSTRYEAAVREGAARTALAVALVTPPTPGPESPEIAALSAALEAALEAHASRSAGLKEAVAGSERLAFEVQRAGQTAAAAAAAYPFLGFPPEAQVAQAAALAAEAASRRAAEASSKLTAAVDAAKKEAAPTVPADLEQGLAQAVEFARARGAACE